MKRVLARIFCSPAIWIIICLLAVDLCVTYAKPLQYLQITGFPTFTDDDPLSKKLDKLTAQTTQPDLVLIGSSLGMTLYRADYRLPGESHDRAKRDMLSTELRYLDKLLADKLAKPITTFNLALAGGMISDDYAVLDYLVTHNATPPQILLTLAPRDFVDNHFSAETSSYRRSLGFRNDPLIGFKTTASNVGKILSNSNSLSEKTDACLSELWAYYRVRSNYKSMVEYIASNCAERAPTLYGVSKAAAATYSRRNLQNVRFTLLDNNSAPVNSDPDKKISQRDFELRLNSYRESYNPLNRDRMDQEFGYLDQLLQCATANHIGTTVAYMPLTAENMALLPASAEREIRTKLEAACHRYQIPFINLNKPELFTSSDFIDDVHLNSYGSVKFLKALVDQYDRKLALSVSRSSR
jgi:hypothetical protein